MNPIDTVAHLMNTRNVKIDDRFLMDLRKQIQRDFRLTVDGAKRAVLSALNEHKGRAYNGQVEFRKTYY